MIGGRELMSSSVTARCGWNDKDLVADIEDIPCVFVWRWLAGSSCGCHGRIPVILELVIEDRRPQELLLWIEEGAKDSTTTRQQESGCRHNINNRWNRNNNNNNNTRWHC
jgi:hypothetical protein